MSYLSRFVKVDVTHPYRKREENKGLAQLARIESYTCHQQLALIQRTRAKSYQSLAFRVEKTHPYQELPVTICSR